MGVNITAQAQQSNITTNNTSLKSIISKGDKSILAKITTLNLATNKIKVSGHLNDNQKSSVTEEITVNITGLNTLITKLDSETDANAAQADVNNIATKFRISGIFIPKIILQVTAYAYLNTVDKLNSAADKLNQKILAEIALGKNEDKAKANYTDLLQQITTFKSETNNALSQANTLTADGYPNNLNTIDLAHDSLDNASDKLYSIRKDIRDSVKYLRRSLRKVATTTDQN